MINSIGSSSSYYNSLFATNGTSGTGSTNSSSSLSQTEEQLFAAIDTNGDGSLSQTEFDNFLQQASGSTNTTQANALFSQLSGGSVSLQQFESNAGTLASALTGSSASGSSSSSSAASLLSQLQQSAQSLVSASAASITGSQNSSSTSNTNGSNSTGHHGHHGHGGNSLISQFVQQYQAAGGTTAAASTLTATA